PDAGRAIDGAHVRPHVRLWEERDPRNCGTPRGADGHPERNQPDPCRVVERLGRQARRQQALHAVGLVRPVQERDLGPAHSHDRIVDTLRNAPGVAHDPSLGANRHSPVVMPVGVVGSTGAQASTKPSIGHRSVWRGEVRIFVGHRSPPTTKDCEQQLHIACYAPFQLQNAYDLNALYSGGWDGTGSTIALVDSFGSPTAEADLARFDADFGLP